MKRRFLIPVALLALLSTFNCHLSTLFAQGTAFTYQGRLSINGSPANGSYDLRFNLYTNISTGNPVTTGLTNPAVVVANGLFTTTLDFGGVFNGTIYWLDIGARANGSAVAFVALTTRQQLTPSPYAIFAASAGVANGTVVRSLNGLTDLVNLSAGSGVSITPSGNNLQISASGGTSGWALGGNSGTSLANFLGTTDNQRLELAVNNAPALRLVPTADTPQVIGGASINTVAAGIHGATIAGGGSIAIYGAPYPNQIFATHGTIGGGLGNTIRTNAYESTIAGGNQNFIDTSANRSVIGGGFQNSCGSNAAFVGGGTINHANGSSSTIGGGYDNTVSANASTIGGGARNRVSGDFGAIGGGENNTATAEYSTVAGGAGNTAGEGYSTVAGGNGNSAISVYSMVGGGHLNTASLSSTVSGGQFNTTSGFADTIGGGYLNSAGGNYATLSGGYANSAGNSYGTVGGGVGNNATAPHAVIAGGNDNTNSGGASVISGGQINNVGGGAVNSVIGGGYDNTVDGNTTVIGGGASNRVSGAFGAIGGGENNYVFFDHGAIGGGIGNYASGVAAAVPGGANNSAQGSYSFAAGRRAKAIHAGNFVWADSQDADWSPQSYDSVSFRCSGGVLFTTGSGAANQSVSWYSGQGSWSFSSDRNLKDRLEAVDTQAVLEKLSRLSISEWSYKDFPQRHIGAMAQDFHALFPLNDNDKMLNDADLHGVALAAIQGLNQKVENREARIQELEQRLEKLEHLMNHHNEGVK